ncbi:glycosyltransferase family 2 protein [Aurantiacibacter poecillastricola]|uniref:glycosyltransferase family 2 protein n=1 Tax=Aurantiacibacter poecillastricola TaxID=3064385 RepID=UPI00273D2E12|nr:glycosyltransferase family A protein [Aurantiacibacter sp. 219JJ12-13]MDP5262589.1 glycosyltransferase family A protein [Aurantiacibacter sp. 219JJ12-13]
MIIPRITVLMAVHDGERFLPQTLASISAQTLTDYEFVIVDDCSRDASPAILSAAASSDDRIRIHTNAANMGLTRSLNRGLEAAQGRYITRIDADDVAHPERLAMQAEFLDSHPDHVLVGSNEIVIDATGRTVRHGRGELDAAAFRYLSAYSPPIVHSSACFRRATLLAKNLVYDETKHTAQDFDFWLKLQQHGYGHRLPQRLVSVRQHGASISATRCREQSETAVDISGRALIDRCGKISPERLRALAAFVTAGEVPHKGLSDVVATAFAVERAFLEQMEAGRETRRAVRRLTVNTLMKGVWRAFGNDSPTWLRSQLHLLRQRPITTATELCAIAARRLS